MNQFNLVKKIFGIVPQIIGFAVLFFLFKAQVSSILSVVLSILAASVTMWVINHPIPFPEYFNLGSLSRVISTALFIISLHTITKTVKIWQGTFFVFAAFIVMHNLVLLNPEVFMNIQIIVLHEIVMYSFFVLTTGIVFLSAKKLSLPQ
ncbi:MAG: hypothetical protein IPM74_05545 [Crocinitomicaceae bacterium]|nr:hypothetical protein [Crocinitomicaceae bacterium]MBK8925367.1 hypothetical protein [Crocinitomicaceae bacterium]